MRPLEKTGRLISEHALAESAAGFVEEAQIIVAARIARIELDEPSAGLLYDFVPLSRHTAVNTVSALSIGRWPPCTIPSKLFQQLACVPRWTPRLLYVLCDTP
jgi:hypothetical protein